MIKKGDTRILFGEAARNKQTPIRIESAIVKFEPGMSRQEVRVEACKKLPLFPVKKTIRLYEKMHCDQNGKNQENVAKSSSFRIQSRFVNEPLKSPEVDSSSTEGE